MFNRKRCSGWVLCVVLAAGSSMANGNWLHVRIVDGGENVRVNVPLSVVETVLPMLDLDEFNDGTIHLENHGIEQLEGLDLHEILAALGDSPDADFVKIRSDDGDVRVSKMGGYLLVNVEEEGTSGDRVKVRVPLDVVRAMVADDPRRIDLLAGLRTLSKNHPNEDLISVESDDASIRVWIDSSDSGD